MENFTLLEMMRHGWPVLLLLLGASIASIAIISDRYIALRNSRVDVRPFLRQFLDVLERRGRLAAMEACRGMTQPLPNVLCGILAMEGSRIDMERRARHILRAQMRELETRVPVLGTIGSIAPFVGLFGTVVGIVKAFRDISLSSGGGPEVVSGGIAEALITTATGLLVAIPAIIGYNYFVTRLRRMAEEIDLAAYEVIDYLATEKSEDR